MVKRKVIEHLEDVKKRVLFIEGLIDDRNTINKEIAFKTVLPPEIARSSRNAVLAHHMHYGSTGKGKTVALCYWTLKKYNLKAPKFGIPNGFKILWIDIIGKGEMACAFLPMDKNHTMYPVLKRAGIKPESYPVQVLRPLVFIRGKPDLVYEQPSIVVPFTLALSDLTITEWKTLLPGGLSNGQTNLLSKALSEIKNKKTASVHDLIVKCQKIITEEEVGYSSNLPGQKKTKSIKYVKGVFSGREAKGLLQKLEVLANTGLVQPEVWDGKPVATNLDLISILKDKKTISVLFVPRYKDLPHLHLSVVNYFLNHIYYLKHPNTQNRIQQPLCIVIPELRLCVPKGVSGADRYFVEPLKSTLLEINSSGAGMGISLIGDTQFYEQIDNSFRVNVTSQFIFDMGEKAAEKIREILKNRYVTNLKEITEPQILGRLKETGTFIYLSADSIRAEIRKNAVVPFWYPRSRGKRGESETNFYDLFKSSFPSRMVDIRKLYNLLIQISQSTQTKASEMMDRLIAAKERKKVKTKHRKKVQSCLSILERLAEVSDEESLFNYSDLVKDLCKSAGKSRSQISRDLRKIERNGFLFIDDSTGTRKKKVILYSDKIKEALEEMEEKSSA